MMHSKRFTPWLLAAAFALFLAGCATPGEDEERVEDQDDELTEEEMAALDEEERRAAEARAARERGALEGEALEAALEDPDSPISDRVVYFAFDSSDIRDEDMTIIEAHGAFLSDHPEQQVTIEGHTDERGAREYNLALGERRAESVKRILVLSGASEDQLEVVSYGEENPAVSGSNEEAYEQNRRAELVY